MREYALEVLNLICNYGYEAYIVGGFVRDSLLGINSKDIDITTNATPMELKNIFPNLDIINSNYGAVLLEYKGVSFEITTFRMESNYEDNRHPSSVMYVNDLNVDLIRRDFTINALCIDKNDQIIDLVNGKTDLENKILRTIGNSQKSFQDDALRILRAIRFASYLDFKMSDEIIEAIKDNKKLLKNISYQQKKKELDKIFASNKAYEGIKLIQKYELDSELELFNLDRIKDYSDIVGIWAMINSSKYIFTSSEKDLIEKINIVYDLDNLDKFVLYKYGLYVNILAAVNKKIDKKEIITRYDELPIKNRDEIDIDAKEICKILNCKPGSIIGDIYNDLENKIILGELINNKNDLILYIVNNYQQSSF